MNKESKPARGTKTDIVIEFIKNQILKAKEQGLITLLLHLEELKRMLDKKSFTFIEQFDEKMHK